MLSGRLLRSLRGSSNTQDATLFVPCLRKGLSVVGSVKFEFEAIPITSRSKLFLRRSTEIIAPHFLSVL